MLANILGGRDHAAAAEKLRKTFELGWRAPELLFYSVEAAILRGALEDAEHQLTVLIQFHPTSPFVALARADVCLERGEWDEAQALVLSAVSAAKPSFRVDAA